MLMKYRIGNTRKRMIEEVRRRGRERERKGDDEEGVLRNQLFRNY